MTRSHATRPTLILWCVLNVTAAAAFGQVWNGTGITGLGWRQDAVGIGQSWCPGERKLCIRTPAASGTTSGIWMEAENQKAIGLLTNMAAFSWSPMTKEGDHMILFKGPTAGDPQAGLVLAPWNFQAGGLRIAENGNVGIGTPNPGVNRLAVDGTVKAREVIVTLDGWPDHVFESNYDLMPLDELAARIEREGHLPGIPSAEEAALAGVGVGQMQAKLLEKIEEMTLYLIALKKENDELRSRLDSIEVAR